MEEKRKPIEYVILFTVTTLLGLIAGLFLANFIFVKWQNIPQSLYSYHVIFDYKKVYGDIPKVGNAIKLSMLSMLLPAFLLDLIVFVALFAKPKREQHGSAKFANPMQIRKSGLMLTPKQQAIKKKKKPSNPSILVGKYKETLLEFWGNEFTFVAAPTRSGKGVGIVIPNLLHYPDSVVVLDIKNENWDITAGFRSKYQECFLFAPKAEDGRSHCYNPLDYIDRDHTKRMGDIGNIGNILYPADSADGTTAYFNSQAQRLFTGVVLYMLETPNRPCSMAELLRLTTPTSGEPFNEWIVSMIQERSQNPEDSENPPLTIECIAELMSFAGNSSENTRAGIQSSMTAPLNVFTDPMVAAATSKSDFRLDDVRRKRMSIYVGIQPNELPRFDKLLNLFFSQLISLNTRVLPEQDPTLRYQCLVLLDEFTALGKVDIINKAVAYIAGYNMRLMLIFQNKSQCEQYYTREGTQTMLSNMACQIVFAPRTIDDAKSYSELLGTETIKGKSVSKNKGKDGGGSVSTSDQSRALMLPQEMMELEQAKEIVIYNANKPILADKIKYYEDPILSKRQNLKIKESCIPAVLDVKAMLDVMRGIITKPVDVENLTAEELVENHPDYVKSVAESFGVSLDFFNLTEDEDGKIHF